VDGLEVEGCDGSELLVERKATFLLSDSGLTWALYVPGPVAFVCRNGTVGGPSLFTLTASKPLREGFLRLAMADNCTTGANDAV